MKVNNWLIIPLVLIGLAVFAISLYMASLSGVMSKMGLVGGDFSQSIKQNELARQIRSQNEVVDCSTANIVKLIPSYLISKGEKKVSLAGVLGGERIICGVRLVQDGNVERGVYTIIKGLYYMKTHYIQMRSIVENDKNNCRLLGNPTYERWVEGYLMATDGRIHEVVLNVYGEVERSRSRVEEMCLD
jgi:hypothetical protein